MFLRNSSSATQDNIALIGPGTITLTGNQVIDEIVAGTNLTVIDGWVRVRKMHDSVTLTTQKNALSTPLDINVNTILGIVTINAAGNVTIERAFTDRVSITAENDIYADDVGNASELTAASGQIKTKVVGASCLLTANTGITCGAVSSASQLTSNNGGITAVSLNNNCYATANGGDLHIKHFVGVGCTLNTTAQMTIGDDVGATSALRAAGKVTCHGDIGANAAVESEADAVMVGGKIQDGAAVYAYKALTVNCGVGVQSALESGHDSIHVIKTDDGRNHSDSDSDDDRDIELNRSNGKGGGKGKDKKSDHDHDKCSHRDKSGKRGISVETQSALRAFNDITIAATLDQGVNVRATEGSVTLSGVAGPESRLESTELIEVTGFVGHQALLKCPGGTIEIKGGVSNSATLTADHVIINGVPQNQSARNLTDAAVVSSQAGFQPRRQHSFWNRMNEKHQHADRQVLNAQPSSPRL